MKAYLVDVGILLSEGDMEFNSYNMVYDKSHGYFDEDQFYVIDKQEAIDYVKQYVGDGVNNTYGIISETELDDDITSEDIENGNVSVSGETYSIENVCFNLAKINDKVVEFLNI